MNNHFDDIRKTLGRIGMHSALFCGLTFSAQAQMPAYSHSGTPTATQLEQAASLFDREQWNECLDQLQELRTLPLTLAEREANDYMEAVASAHKDLPGSMERLQNFLRDYPQSIHRAEVQLALGSYLLFHHDYTAAWATLSQIQTQEIPTTLQHQLYFRKGQTLIAQGMYADARPYYVALERANDTDFSTEASYYVAYLDYQQGAYDSALKRFKQLPDDTKYRQTAPYYVAQILFHQAKWGEALSLAQRLLNEPGTSPEQKTELNRIVGECLMQNGHHAEALKYLTTYIHEASPAIASSAYNCGVLAGENGDEDLAMMALSKATATGGNDAVTQKAYLRLGQIYTHRGELHNAQMAFERAATLTADPEAQEAAAYNYAMMVHETAYSPFNEEVTVFENFLNKYPYSRYADKAGECLVEVYMTTRNYDAALASIGKIKRPSAHIQTAKQRLLYQIGVQALVNGNRETAIDKFNQCIALGSLNNNTLADACYWRGDAYYHNGQYDLAERDFNRFLSLKPNGEAAHLASGYYNLGYARFKQNKFDGAIEALTHYTTQPSELGTASYTDALARLGDCYYYKRSFAEAESYYNTAANAGDPATADYALYQKAFMAGLQKKYTVKLNDLDILIQKYPESEYQDEAFLEKGKTYLLLDNREEAIRSFQAVVDRYPNRSCAPQAGLQLALVYYNVGRTDDAIRTYKQVIRLHPGSEEAQTALDDLKNIYVERNEVNAYAGYLTTLDGKVPMAADEQDSLTYIAATKLLANGKQEAGQRALTAYVGQYPNGKYAVDANIMLARAARAGQQNALALKYYEAVSQMTGGAYVCEALSAMAELYVEKGDNAQAYDAYRSLSERADNAEYRRTALMGCTRTAYALARHDEVIAHFTQANADAALSAAWRQEGHLLRGKSYLATRQPAKAADDLKTASADMRSEAGAEAKYLLAQFYFDEKKPAEAEAQIFELINAATPHQYWLARGFILLADISIGKGDTFQAKQYLQSLQNNYNSNTEINQMIETRLDQCK